MTRRREIRSRGSDEGWDWRETCNWVTSPLAGLGVGLVLGARRTWETPTIPNSNWETPSPTRVSFRRYPLCRLPWCNALWQIPGRVGARGCGGYKGVSGLRPRRVGISVHESCSRRPPRSFGPWHTNPGT